jgi:hypothetical protein
LKQCTAERKVLLLFISYCEWPQLVDFATMTAHWIIIERHIEIGFLSTSTMTFYCLGERSTVDELIGSEFIVVGKIN